GVGRIPHRGARRGPEPGSRGPVLCRVPDLRVALVLCDAHQAREGPGGGAGVNLVEQFAEAFNRRDVDGLLDCFTPDATYRYLFYGPHAGPAALRGMFERMFREGQDYHWSMDVSVEDERRAAAEWAFA